MEHESAESALQFVILLLAHVIDLLRYCGGVDFREPAGAQKLRLTARPRVEIGLFRVGSSRLLKGRALGHLYPDRLQLSAIFSALSGSSWPKQRW